MNSEAEVSSSAPGKPSPTEQWLVSAFAERVRSVAGQVSFAKGIEEAGQIIAGEAQGKPDAIFTASAAALSAFPALHSTLLNSGISLRIAEELEYNPEQPSGLAATLAGDVGIIVAVAGVAETGSFLASDETLPTRLLGMLSDTVFALLPASKIVPTLDEMGDILSRMSAEGRRYLSMVTGPSRTADIERVLTIGVQGPRVLHVIVLSDGKE